jgi:hypothetical protein
MRQPQTNPDGLDHATPLAPIVAALLALAVIAGLDGCHPRLPPVSGCTPAAQSCRDDRPQVCSASQRWEPAGDRTCASVGGVCVVTGGVAHCAPVDGGAP